MRKTSSSQGRKIALVGSDTGKSEAPFGDKGWELWSLNNLYIGFHAGRKFDRWYELHVFEKTNKYINDEGPDTYIRRGVDIYNTVPVEDYMKDIAKLNIPTFMQKKWDIIPKSEVFPFEKIMEKFSTRYFGCSFTWMLAHALYEHMNGKKVDEIGFYGINLSGVEYYQQRPTLEYFMGIAYGMGIKLTTQNDSELLKMPFVYAYDEDFDMIDALFAQGGKRMAMLIETTVQQYLTLLKNGN